MKIKFYKYEGTGNDFIIIDNRQTNLLFKVNRIKKLCDRRYGIGADGLILMENDLETDFKMVYFNSDGNQSSMCGNGARCIVAFAQKINLITDQTTFLANDGLHQAFIFENGIISLGMNDVDQVKMDNDYTFLDTGSPHHIVMVEDLDFLDVKKNGAKIRFSSLYGSAGSNVNFVKQLAANHFRIRTYERGVEDETYSCGTGATATAIAMNALGKTKSNYIKIDVEGGNLEVSFDKEKLLYTNVFLKGPATFVYQGEIVW